MREIQFRAFDGKEMIPCLVTIHGTCGVYLSTEEYEDEKYPIMQYIGIEDKNGRKIFEGDILADHYKNGKYCNLHEVKWEKSYMDTDGNYYICGFALPTTTYHDSGLEIIGNVYQNPELLKEIND